MIAHQFPKWIFIDIFALQGYILCLLADIMSRSPGDLDETLLLLQLWYFLRGIYKDTFCFIHLYRLLLYYLCAHEIYFTISVSKLR